jgi:hypothetical protein
MPEGMPMVKAAAWRVRHAMVRVTIAAPRTVHKGLLDID